MKVHKNEKKRLIFMVVAAVGLFFIGVFFVQYLGTVSRTRDKEVTSQLSQVYGQVNNRFMELSEKNWNLLYDGALAYGLSEDEGLMEEYISHLKQQWKFREWLFVDDNGNYMDAHGNTGCLNLDREILLLTQNKEHIVADSTLAGTEPVMLFAVPAAPGTYKDFSFTAVALAYTKESMKQVLYAAAYEGQSDCCLISPDGRILLSLLDEMEETENIFTLLDQAEFETTAYENVRNEIENGQKGTCRYILNKTRYYLYYQPVGFQDWMIAGIVPQKYVGKYVDQVLTQIVGLSVICFGMIMAVFMGLLYNRSRQEIRKTAEQLSYRDQLFEILSGNNTSMFLVIIPNVYQAEYISSNAERIVGFSKEAIMKDISILQKAEHLERKDLKWEDLKTIPIGEMASLETIRYHGITGEKLWFEESIYHVKTGNIERYIFVLQDRTKERQDHQNLETALEIAKTANESKSAFLSNMSHDIRTPMNVIIGFLPLLMRDAENAEKVREYARKINASSQHLLGLINDILDMSKIESGKTSLNISEFELADFIDNLAMIVRPQASIKNQSFDITVQDIRNERLMGDSMKLKQILINILSNAVKYTQAGGSIQLIIRQLPQPTKNTALLQFVITDNGCGMSEEYQKRIFEPFTREETGILSYTRGTGLGMSIVKSLVDLMGGSVTVKSRLKEGSTFTVELGLRVCEENVDQDFWKKHNLSRTLVVDDDPDICENVVQTVLHSGLAMEYALGGEEAIEKIKAASEEKRPYHLVLLDWKMPGMDGVETAKRIRDSVPDDVPIMILTTYDWSEIEEDAKNAGINGFVAKPFFLSSFMDTVEHVCSTPAGGVFDGGESRMQGMHFLVAEDYALNAEILKGILEMYGVTCEVCEDGLETVWRFEASAPGEFDLILMDIQMPVMNGCDATMEIRRSSHPEAETIPIIAMSANAFSEDVQEALAAGMDEYLTKPVDARLLESTLVRVLEERKNRM